MRGGARRPGVRAGVPRARRLQRAQHAVCVVLGMLVPAETVARTADTCDLVGARYTEPTTRYAHGVLGDAIEHGALELTFANPARTVTLRLPQERVFEDTAARIVDVDADGCAEVVVVESHRNQGARLAIYGADGLIAATPYIGRTNRWLAPVGVADLDGDGRVELAYIDRPHLAKTLRVWRFDNGDLHEVASRQGFTNHRIGERDIAGGVRRCGKGPELIVANADWSRLMAVTLNGKTLTSRTIGTQTGRADFAAALQCK